MDANRNMNTTSGGTGTSTQTTDGGANMVTDINGNRAANRGGAVNTVLPSGSANYTYYADANTYYNPRTKVWYYQRSGEWVSGTKSPQGVRLGTGQTVRMQGQSNTNGASQ